MVSPRRGDHGHAHLRRALGDAAPAGESAVAAVIQSMHDVDEMMSTYRAGQPAVARQRSRGAGAGQGRPRTVRGDPQRSKFSRLTHGAFDVTYASVGYLYDFRAHQRPTEAQIERRYPASTGATCARPRGPHRGSTTPACASTSGGIAKGLAVDRAIGLLQARGIAHAVVTAGGDSRDHRRPLRRPWIVGIRHPDDPKRVITRIPLVDTAMSTSGDYAERYFDENGVRYHHIIDPKTGHSASKVRSATILAPTAMQTDGLSKTAFVLGAEEALKIIEAIPGVDAIFVTPRGRCSIRGAPTRD